MSRFSAQDPPKATPRLSLPSSLPGSPSAALLAPLALYHRRKDAGAAMAAHASLGKAVAERGLSRPLRGAAAPLERGGRGATPMRDRRLAAPVGPPPRRDARAKPRLRATAGRLSPRRRF